MERTVSVATATNRPRLLLLALAGLALALWLLRRAPAGAAAEEVRASAAASASAPAAALPDAPAPQRSASRSKPLRIEDRLSGAELDLEVRILDGESELDALRPGEVVDLSRYAERCVLAYELESVKLEHEAQLGDCLREADDRWILALPYTCRLEFSFSSPSLPLCPRPGQLMLCQDPRTLAEAPISDERPGPFTRPTEDMSLAGLLHWKLRCGQLKSVQQAAISAPEPAPLSLSAAGPFVVSAQFPDGSSGVAPALLIPGEVVTVALPLRARPALRGRLLDWEGNPVPDEKIVLTVALDLADYDLRPGDPHGLMAYREEGVLTQSVKKTYRTDADGAFELSVPRGKEYALYSYALGGYAFWSTLSGGAPADAMSCDLQLAEPSEANRVEITVLQPDGRPLSAGRIDIGVAGDLPFFRQWPAGLELDEQGSVTVSGMEPGMLIGLMIHHDSLARGIYAPQYPTVPASRKIEVRLPSESYLAFQ